MTSKEAHTGHRVLDGEHGTVGDLDELPEEGVVLGTVGDHQRASFDAPIDERT